MVQYCILNKENKLLGIGNRYEATKEAFSWYLSPDYTLHVVIQGKDYRTVCNYSDKPPNKRIWLPKYIKIHVTNYLLDKSSIWGIKVFKSINM